MAIDVEALIIDAFLGMCKEREIKDIAIKDVIEKTGISKQTFYNYFRDKNDLIQDIYLKRIIPKWEKITPEFDYYASLQDTFNRYEEYAYFMKQACSLNGDDCLCNFMNEYCETFDLEWYKKCYGGPLPEKLVNASKYHSLASMNFTIMWILADMPSPPEEMAEIITLMRHSGLDRLLKHYGKKVNPYDSSVNLIDEDMLT